MHQRGWLRWRLRWESLCWPSGNRWGRENYWGEKKRHPTRAEASRPFASLSRHQPYLPQQTGRERLQMIHILRLETLAISRIQFPVIGQGAAGEPIDCQVGHYNA